MAASRRELAEVAGFVARIAREVLVRGELAGIDEDRDERALGQLASAAHQRQVPGVQRPHGRNERDLVAVVAPLGDDAAQIGDAADDLKLAGHVVSLASLAAASSGGGVGLSVKPGAPSPACLKHPRPRFARVKVNRIAPRARVTRTEWSQ